MGELTGAPLEQFWVRGGFPESLLAKSDGQSLQWRRDFIRTYLEREIPQFGPRVAAETLRRFGTMLAHRQGAPLNIAGLARNVGPDARAAARYVDLLADLLLARRLLPWHANVGKRLAKSPRLYLRDSGRVHALLGIEHLEGLLAHPLVGASWGGFAIENLLAVAPQGWWAHDCRTSGGAEVGLPFQRPGGRLWAVEIKRTTASKATRGFHEACLDLGPKCRFVVYPGTEGFPLGESVEAVPPWALAQAITTAGENKP